MKNKKILLIALAAAGFAACEPEFDHEVSDADYSAGDADFTTYVAVGNSLTAGYMDNSVSRVGQSYSYPKLLADQFAVVGGGPFTQPSYEEDVNNLGGIAGIPGFGNRLILNASTQSPEPIAGVSTITLTPQAKAFNNTGVPGAKSFHLLAPGYGSLQGLATGQANPYFVRTATSASATVLGDAMSLHPTFFTNWIGSNDVLAYATAGGTGVDQTGNMNPATYGFNDITDQTYFAGVYSAIVTTLTSEGAKGVVSTIPNVTTIPFFTTVPYAPLTASVIGQGDEAVGVATINQLNALYGGIKQALTAFGAGDRINLLSTTAPNPLLIKDESLQNLQAQLTAALTPSFGAPTAAFIGSIYGQARQATAADLVLLTTRTVIGTTPAGAPAPFDKFGITYPLQDQHVLTAAEVALVNTATTSYNSSIRTIAAAKNLAVADMNAILTQLSTGFVNDDGQVYYGNYFSAATINTSLFSLDGVHPNARGYALIANEILKVINEHYHAKLPLIVPGYYPGATILPSN
jgi:lysophospholipase L1-like esterase